MIDGSAIDKIDALARGAAKPSIEEFHGIKYSDADWIPICPPMPETMNLNTLSGFVDFCKNERGTTKGVAFHGTAVVLSHTQVCFVGKLDDTYQTRKYYARASFTPEVYGPGFPFGQFLSIEEFLIAAQSRILHDEALRSVLAVVGNIQDGHVKTLEDDGVTQVVAAKTGVARLSNMKIENPVTLRPYRTFREIDQPASPFILRFRPGGAESLPTVALFEADGGSWKIEAIDGIAGYLRKNAEGLTVLA